MYGRRLGAKVIPIVEIEKHGLSIGHESGATGDHTILIKIGLRNEGRGIAKYPYIFLENTEGLQHISNPTELPYNTRTKRVSVVLIMSFIRAQKFLGLIFILRFK